MIIKRYISKEIALTLFAVTLVLLMLFLSQQVVRYLNYVVIGKIATNVLMQLISYEVPYLLAILLPLGLYLGILLTYGRMYAENEMSILQMCGFGASKLRGLTFVIASVVAAFVLILMIWINPMISAKRQQLMASDEATLHLIQTLIPGRFQASPDGRHVMYVEKLSRDHSRAENVFLAQEKKNPEDDDAQSSWMLVLANQGYQVKDKESPDQFFVTADGYRYEGTPGESDYKIIQFKKYAVRIPQNDVHAAHLENETLSMTDLWHNYNDPKRAAEFQWRFSFGIAALLLALLAVPMSAVRPRQGRYLTLLPAILIYIVYINMLFIGRHWVEQGTVPVTLGIWWVHGVLALLVMTIMFFSSRAYRKL